MSTATIEEPPAEIVIPEEAPPAPPEAPMTKEQVDELVGEFLSPTVAPAAQKKAEKPDKSTPPPDAPVEKHPEGDKEHNFANLRKKAEEAEKRATEREAELTKVREEYDTFKKNPVPKEYEEKLTAAEKRAQEADDRASRLDLNESPAFQAQFQPGIQEAAGIMVEELKELGIEPAEINAAISTWNKAQFEEWADSMPMLARDRFLRAHTEAINLDARRTKALADHRGTRAKMDAESKAQQEKAQADYFAGLKSERDTVFGELETAHAELFKNAEVRKNTSDALDRAIGKDGTGMTTREMLTALASAQALAHQFTKVDTERKKLSDELDALKKTLGDRDSFIREQHGATPVPGSIAPGSSKAEHDAMIDEFLNPVVKV